jgi:hypothetical protein
MALRFVVNESSDIAPETSSRDSFEMIEQF